MIEDEEKLYTESEILQMIYGLTHVYNSKNWFGKLFYKPFYVALETLAIQIAGDKLTLEADKRAAVDHIENLLDE